MHAPPVLVITAEYDRLRDEDEFCAGKSRTAGVAATLTPYDGRSRLHVRGRHRRYGGCRDERSPRMAARHAHERDHDFVDDTARTKTLRKSAGKSNFSRSMPVLGSYFLCSQPYWPIFGLCR